MINEELFNDVFYSRTNDALTMGMKHNYENLYANVKKYSDILKKYKDARIDRIAVIVGDELNFNTISLILALIKNKITPFIINERINDEIKGILKKEDIKISFYESFIKPEYLEKLEIMINKSVGHFATANPYVNVNDKLKMKDIMWTLDFLKPTKPTTPCVCHLYAKVDGEIVDNIVSEEDLNSYNKILNTEENSKNIEKIAISLPLYKKESISLLITAIAKYINIICLKTNNAEKKLNKILKSKPDVITFDIDMLIELIKSVKYRNIDLSFLKKIVLLTDPDRYVFAHTVLSGLNFKGEYIKPEEIENNKIKKFK